MTKPKKKKLPYGIPDRPLMKANGEKIWLSDLLKQEQKQWVEEVIIMIGSGKYSHEVELTDGMVSNAFLNLKGKDAKIVRFDEFELADDLKKLIQKEKK